MTRQGQNGARSLSVTLSATMLIAGVWLPARAQKKPQTKPPAKPAQTKPKPSARPQPPATGAALIEALKEDEDAAKALALVRRGADPNATNDDQTLNALGLAAGLGDLTLVKALLEKGAKLEAPSSDGYGALVMALDSEHWPIARLLIEKGAQVNVRDGGAAERRPLVMAAAGGQTELVLMLLDKGAEINHAADDGITALSAAAESGKLPLVELLVSHGAKIDGDSRVLLQAVIRGHADVIDYLIAHGRSLTEAVPKTTMLHVAAQSDSSATIQKVLAAGVPIDSIDADGDSALMAAVQMGKVQAVRFLLERKARIDLLNNEYQSALDLAQKDADPSDDDTKALIALLKKAGAKPAPPSLWRGAIAGKLPEVKECLAAGDDPNAIDGFGGVPLFYVLTHQPTSDALPIVKALLAAGANPNVAAPDGRTMVQVARDEGTDAAVGLLRRAGAKTPELDLTEAIERRETPLIDRLLAQGVRPEPDTLALAIVRNDKALLVRLLDKGGKVNAQLRSGGGLFLHSAEFPLHVAVARGNLELVRLLLDRGADPNVRSGPDGVTALHVVDDDAPGEGLSTEGFLDALEGAPAEPLASSTKTPDATARVDAMVRLLVERGADIRAHAGGIGSGSVLAHLAGSASASTLTFLMEKGARADVNPSGDDDVAPLAAAVRAQRLEIVDLLLKAGADPNPRGRFADGTPLMELAQGDETSDSVAMVKLLLARGARLDTLDSGGRNALRLAQEHGNDRIAALLRAAGSRATISPAVEMELALRQGALNTVDRLLKAGLDPNGHTRLGTTFLYEAAMTGDIAAVRLLVERGADVNRKGDLGFPIHAAAGSGEPEIVRFLLARGAQADPDDGFQGTPLARAAEEGDVATAQLLLKAGADPSAKRSEHPGAPLRVALAKGGPAVVDLLLKAGADLNEGSILSIPILTGNVALMERLVKAGAKVNQTDVYERTPLMDAAMLGQKEMVTWLIAHGADVNAKDKSGRTALSEAQDRNKTESVRLLRAAGAK